jgi:hypothetical protein
LIRTRARGGRNRCMTILPSAPRSISISVAAQTCHCGKLPIIGSSRALAGGAQRAARIGGQLAELAQTIAARASQTRIAGSCQARRLHVVVRPHSARDQWQQPPRAGHTGGRGRARTVELRIGTRSGTVLGPLPMRARPARSAAVFGSSNFRVSFRLKPPRRPRNASPKSQFEFHGEAAGAPAPDHRTSRSVRRVDGAGDRRVRLCATDTPRSRDRLFGVARQRHTPCSSASGSTRARRPHRLAAPVQALGPC